MTLPGSAGTYPEMQSSLVQRYCSALVQCPDQTDFGALVSLGLDASQCVQLFTAITEASVIQQAAFEAKGTVSYDPAKGAACLAAATPDAICAQSDTLATVCNDVYNGTVAQGAPCNVDYECAAGLTCFNFQSCPGTCEPKPAVGEQCIDDDWCAPVAGATVGCFYTGGIGTCRTYTRTTVADGEPCADVENNGTYTRADCGSGLFCDYSGASQPMCAPKVAAGGACQSDSACPSGYDCYENVCTQIEVATTVGAPCVADGEPKHCDLFGRLYCDEATSTCAMLGDGAIGSSCPTSGVLLGMSTFVCVDGAYCDRTSSVCTARKAEGESCMASDMCTSRYCDIDFVAGTGTCKSPTELCL